MAFAAILAFMVAGPGYRQVLGGSHPLFRPWTMFSGAGRDLVVARFEARLPDGTVRAVHPFAALGYPERRHAPRWLRRIEGEPGLRKVARRLCAALGPEADLRARARMAAESGWRVVAAGEQNLCALEAPSMREGATP